jgi:hypothetical protein
MDKDTPNPDEDLINEVNACISDIHPSNYRDIIQYAIDAIRDGQEFNAEVRHLVTNGYGYDIFHSMGETMDKCAEVRKILRKVL